MGMTATAQGLKTRLSRGIRQASPSAFYLLKGTANLLRVEKYECNLCGYSGKFLPFGNPPRGGAVCAKCFSKERHRLMALWVSAHPDAVDGARVLHFAPEEVLAKLFRSRSSAYQSADLEPGAADIVINIEAIDLPDASVDLVVCSHVLEHVDDTKALREIHRILRPGGHALLMFPIVEGWDRTYEDPTHTSKADRVRYFGQDDHVRMFGRDVRDRIKAAGFELAEFTAEEPSVSRHGLLRGEKVFDASKA